MKTTHILLLMMLWGCPPALGHFFSVPPTRPATNCVAALDLAVGALASETGTWHCISARWTGYHFKGKEQDGSWSFTFSNGPLHRGVNVSPAGDVSVGRASSPKRLPKLPEMTGDAAIRKSSQLVEDRPGHFIYEVWMWSERDYWNIKVWDPTKGDFYILYAVHGKAYTHSEFVKEVFEVSTGTIRQPDRVSGESAAQERD